MTSCGNYDIQTWFAPMMPSHVMTSSGMHQPFWQCNNGISKPAVDCLFSTLQGATHQVRTGYGDSPFLWRRQMAYSTSWYWPRQWSRPSHMGSCQHSFTQHPHKERLWCFLINPISDSSYIFIGYALSMIPTLLNLIHWLPWILLSTGCKTPSTHGKEHSTLPCGVVVPDKTFWYLIDFAWEKDTGGISPLGNPQRLWPWKICRALEKR